MTHPPRRPSEITRPRRPWLATLALLALAATALWPARALAQPTLVLEEIASGLP